MKRQYQETTDVFKPKILPWFWREHNKRQTATVLENRLDKSYNKERQISNNCSFPCVHLTQRSFSKMAQSKIFREKKNMYKILVVFVPPKGRGHSASLLNYAFFVTRLCWLLLSDVAFRAFLQCVCFCLHYFGFDWPVQGRET